MLRPLRFKMAREQRRGQVIMRTSALRGHWEPQRILSFMRMDGGRMPWMPSGVKVTSLLLWGKQKRQNGSGTMTERSRGWGPPGLRRDGGANGSKFGRNQCKDRTLPTSSTAFSWWEPKADRGSYLNVLTELDSHDPETPNEGCLLLISLGSPEDC